VEVTSAGVGDKVRIAPKLLKLTNLYEWEEGSQWNKEIILS
jgi:hypothetical protein